MYYKILKGLIYFGASFFAFNLMFFIDNIT